MGFFVLYISKLSQLSTAKLAMMQNHGPVFPRDAAVTLWRYEEMQGVLENRAPKLPIYKTDVGKNEKTRFYKYLPFLPWRPPLACTLVRVEKHFYLASFRK